MKIFNSRIFVYNHMKSTGSRTDHFGEDQLEKKSSENIDFFINNYES